MSPNAPSNASPNASPNGPSSSSAERPTAPDLRIEDASPFALWLTLRGLAGEPWRAAIEALASELGGPVFTPHVTLWGRFCCSLAEAQTRVEVLTRAHELDPELPIILMTAHASVPTAIEAMRRGAFDYVEKPIDIEILIDILRNAAAATEKGGR